MGVVSRVADAMIGRRIELPREMTERFPELSAAHYRRGGLPVRVAGWVLGMRSAAAITLWRTIFLDRDTPLSARLLLHELRHVHQFLERKSFPVRYLWQSLRHGYDRNAYEIDARRYSAGVLRASNKEI